MVPDVNKAKNDKGIKTQLCPRTLYYFLSVRIWEDIGSSPSWKQNTFSLLSYLCLPRGCAQSCTIYILHGGNNASDTFSSYLSEPPFPEFVHGPYVSKMPKANGSRKGTFPIMSSHYSCSRGLVSCAKYVCVFHGLFLLVSQGHRSSLSSLLLFSSWHLYGTFTVQGWLDFQHFEGSRF